MSDYFEIDFLDVEAAKSGDAIPLRYELNGTTRIHVVDGGYQDTGDKVVEHIKKYYGNPKVIDSVIVTHTDKDHASGLRKVLEGFQVSELWMLRPWLYANELLPRFSRFTSVDGLIARLKEAYPHIVELETLASEMTTPIPIREPFQGALIGNFRVMAPTKARYLDLVVESDKTPQAVEAAQYSLANQAGQLMEKAAAAVLALIKTAWGIETFSSEETGAENEMSVVQYADFCGDKILLTGDVGRSGLKEAADYAPYAGLTLPGIKYFQVPHHGSRRNVSTELLDRWLGPRLASKPAKGEEKFYAIISAAKADEDHPRRSVTRAMIHRGAGVATTKKGTDVSVNRGAPARGWTAVVLEEYPEEQEE